MDISQAVCLRPILGASRLSFMLSLCTAVLTDKRNTTQARPARLSRDSKRERTPSIMQDRWCKRHARAPDAALFPFRPTLWSSPSLTVPPLRLCPRALQLVLDTVPLTRVSSVEFKKPETPGRGVSRRGSLFRCNSIIDGNELDVRLQ